MISLREGCSNQEGGDEEESREAGEQKERMRAVENENCGEH